MVTVSSRGQVSIPAEVRRELGFEKCSKLLCITARRRRNDRVIAAESEEADHHDIGDPPLHPRIGCKS